MNKTPIYFFPGMSSTSVIFDKLTLDNSKYDLIFLEWLPIEMSESLDDYVKRYLPFIKHENPVLIGVSFGGIIAQEISKKISIHKTIIISSVRSNTEFSRFFHFLKNSQLYKLIPTGYTDNVLAIYKKFVPEKKKKRLELYNKYLPLRDKDYLKWCIREILNWKQKEPLENVIQIHGTKDEVFPIKNIKNAIIIPNGNHAMIIIKYKWFNEHLDKLIHLK